MKFFDKPTQVAFCDEKGNILGGIAFHDFIICGDCGTAFSIEDVDNLNVFENWCDISAQILGN